MPVRFRFLLIGHEVSTVRHMRWLGRVNGALLALAKDDFDVLVTCDQKIPYELDITSEDVAVVVLAAKSNGLADLQPLIPRVLEVLPTLNRGDVIRVSGN